MPAADRGLHWLSTVSKRVLAQALPLSVFTVFWSYRTLALALARRDIEARYRGSILGLTWAFLVPLAMLAVYTLVFSEVFKLKWVTGPESKGQFALSLFAGIIVFNLVAESLNRAPTLLLEHRSYVTRVVFPLEILPWVVVLSALFQALAGTLVFVAFQLAIMGTIPGTLLLVPILLVPPVLLGLCVGWLFSSVGVYLRDLGTLTGLLSTLMLFLAPIFYPAEAVPPTLRPYLYLNPLSYGVETFRGAVLGGKMPDPLLWALYLAGCWAAAWLGLLWFQSTRRGFADVV